MIFGVPTFKDIKPGDMIYFVDPKDSTVIEAEVKDITGSKYVLDYVAITYYQVYGNKNITNKLLKAAETEHKTKVTQTIHVPGKEYITLLPTSVPTMVCTDKERLKQWITTSLNKIVKSKTID